MRQAILEGSMRKWVLVGVSASCLALAACSESGDYAEEAAYDAEIAADAAMSASEDTAAIPALGDIPITTPKLAYTYDYNWRMPAAEIGPLQRRHASLCEQQGPGSCQILAMNKTGEEANEVRGTLQMAVASRQARAFGALLEDEAEDAGAEQISPRSPRTNFPSRWWTPKRACVRAQNCATDCSMCSRPAKARSKNWSRPNAASPASMRKSTKRAAGSRK